MEKLVILCFIKSLLIFVTHQQSINVVSDRTRKHALIELERAGF